MPDYDWGTQSNWPDYIVFSVEPSLVMSYLTNEANQSLDQKFDIASAISSIDRLLNYEWAKVSAN